jgi:hypothetical protein
MAKQTDRKNKSSKKNYSFTGHRIINSKKSMDDNQYSDSNVRNTTEEMRQLLDTDNSKPNYSNLNKLSSLDSTKTISGYNNDAMSEHNMMGVPMNNQMMGVPMNNQMMGVPMNNQMMGVPMNNQMMGVPMNNQMMGLPNMAQPNLNNIDPTLVNNLVPLNNNQMKQIGNNHDNLLNPLQMAQSLGGLTNLSKLSNSQQAFLQNPSQHLQQSTIQAPAELMGNPNFKNLAALNSIKML